MFNRAHPNTLLNYHWRPQKWGFTEQYKEYYDQIKWCGKYKGGVHIKEITNFQYSLVM